MGGLPAVSRDMPSLPDQARRGRGAGRVAPQSPIRLAPFLAQGKASRRRRRWPDARGRRIRCSVRAGSLGGLERRGSGRLRRAAGARSRPPAPLPGVRLVRVLGVLPVLHVLLDNNKTCGNKTCMLASSALCACARPRPLPAFLFVCPSCLLSSFRVLVPSRGAFYPLFCF